MRTLASGLLVSMVVSGLSLRAADSLPQEVPQTYDALWAGYDPQKEPLEVELLKEWEQDGVVLRVIRYQIGIFKGQKAMMAGIYGFPKGGTKLPALLQIHGGGQFADYRAPLSNAKRGYATLSIAWAGRIAAPGYQVGPNEVRLFWEGRKENPAFKLTTDWGPLDAYHAPCRNNTNSFEHLNAASWTLDSVDSPRNNPWFLCTLGARRGLTFLQRQTQVDGERLGVYGHSMGGKITVLTTASDSRVKAAVPSCGGLSNRYSPDALYRATIGDDQSLRRISCPILFLSPANDFHGRIDDLQKALTEISSPDWRMSCSPHLNHQDLGEYQGAGLLWFDQHLKESFRFPSTPVTSLELKSDDGVARFRVVPDPSRRILGVDIFYTQQGEASCGQDNRENTIARFWHHAPSVRQGQAWTAPTPVFSVDKPLWIYANVLYGLDEPVTGAGYYYGGYTTPAVSISSKMAMVSPQQLLRATLKPSWQIENFQPDWQKEWFTYDTTGDWPRRTHKIYDPQYQAPPGARLSLRVRAEKSNPLVIGLDGYAAEVTLKGDNQWQTVVLSLDAFGDGDDQKLTRWLGLKELSLGSQVKLARKAGSGPKSPRILGGPWTGAAPEFGVLEWVVAPD